jgi:hypothetical protein
MPVLPFLLHDRTMHGYLLCAGIGLDLDMYVLVVWLFNESTQCNHLPCSVDRLYWLPTSRLDPYIYRTLRTYLMATLHCLPWVRPFVVNNREYSLSLLLFVRLSLSSNSMKIKFHVPTLREDWCHPFYMPLLLHVSTHEHVVRLILCFVGNISRV